MALIHKESRMSILSNIFGRILHRKDQPQPEVATASAGPQTAPASAAQAAPQAPTATASMQQVDVEAVLNGMASSNGQKLNWRTSIVDLMKLLDLDSSLQARKELADELHYTGDKADSASMNIWLHKQVMKKLAENGGKVPADLKD
jgi:pyruvate/2-oxoglutarate dehydrogenase complex dihydrolipoamide acyltransferase (E2) component